MIEGYLTEEEQLERIKQWLKKYGWSIFFGIVIGVGLMFAWQYWNSYQLKQRQQASMIYQQLMVTLQEKPESFAKQAVQLIEKHPKSPYAALSQMLLAQQAVNQQQWQAAIDHLTWIELHSNNDFKQLAKARHARLLLFQKNYDQALSLLNEINDSAFATVAEEIKGDVLFAQGKLKEARQAYQQALAHSTEAVPAWQFVLQMKINSLPALSVTEDKA